MRHPCLVPCAVPLRTGVSKLDPFADSELADSENADASRLGGCGIEYQRCHPRLRPFSAARGFLK